MAFEGDEAAGCIALKKLKDNSCEMKRLYVRPKFRGQGIGKALTEAIIAKAKDIVGYTGIHITWPTCRLLGFIP
ncbi:MAG: GNAT family N-acetyltransferase [Eubacteriales bacterium]